jgi:NAD(P)-dependent dehydrogenase (short-subunit alcohol dehydrogenase family)
MSRQDGRLAGKTAVITGAGEGLGRAIALRFAQEGARLALIDIDAKLLAEVRVLLEAAGADPMLVAGDATEEDVAEGVARDATARFGQVDILVNNVGGARVGRIWDIPAADWDFAMRLNLRPTFLFSAKLLPQMLERKSGRVICMSSGAREGTPWMAAGRGSVPYATTKAAIHGFIRQLSLEVAESGVTVNAIAPGAIATSRLANVYRKMDAAMPDRGPIKLTPMRRLGEPVEVADAAVFLASDEASYITGVTLPVTGGR